MATMPERMRARRMPRVGPVATMEILAARFWSVESSATRGSMIWVTPVKIADRKESTKKTFKSFVIQRPSQKAIARLNSVNVNFLRGKKSAKGRTRSSPVASPAKARVGILATPA